MLHTSLRPGQQTFGQSDRKARASQAAAQLYHFAYNQGQRRMILSALIRRSRCLLDLAMVEATCQVHDHCYAGTRRVPIRQIRGSEGRCGDFDAGFNPLQTRTRDRWLNVATARQLGVSLPPVELIQVGEVFFVRDGHHRVSVARALGEKEIDAVVTVWQVADPSPTSRPVTTAQPAGQSA